MLSSTRRNSTSTTLTRREARAIERQTGVGPVADATQALSALTFASVAKPQASSVAKVEETGRIERNAITSLLSVVPAGQVPIAQASAGKDEADAPRVSAAFTGERAMTVRAPRPKQLVARRRVAGGLAVAASLAAVTTVGAIVPSTMAVPPTRPAFPAPSQRRTAHPTTQTRMRRATRRASRRPSPMPSRTRLQPCRRLRPSPTAPRPRS